MPNPEVQPAKVSRPRRSRKRTNGAETDTATLSRTQLLAALRALKRGDFSARLPDGMSGIDGQICEVFNQLATQASDLGNDFTELQRTIVSEGLTRSRLASTSAAAGWAQYVRCTNQLLDSLTSHADEIADVVAAVSRGELGHTISVHGARGDFLKHAQAVNAMVQQLGIFGSEVTRVARQVGVEGKLGAQAEVPGVSGVWKELTDSVNLMAHNLTTQVREIARVTTAVAKGDLTKTVTVDVQGEILQLKNTINTMIEQLSSFAAEVTRVAREVGTEGQLGGQAQVRGVSGVWRELTENVNSMANNLTNQVRNVAEVSSAIAAGDLSKKITVEVKGEILQLKNTINTMVDQLSAFAAEVTRVAREVGTEGVLGGQAEVAGVSGVWRELTENVNSMATNLTNQVRNIAEVVTAVAEGDLSHQITVDAQGEILTLKTTINATVDKLSHFSEEVTRVARLVGTEGTLGVQANVEDVSGIWKELTDNVNSMAANLTSQVRNIAEVTTSVAQGDLSRKITVEVKGEILQLKNTINDMVDSLSSFADEVTRMAREVGTEGVLGGQAHVRDVSGIWKELTDNVNSMARNLTNQVRNIAEVARAVAQGDLSRKITVDAQGEVLDLKDTLNNMVDQLNAFGAEVTRVAHEVGVEGRLGGQAEVQGARGIWKELTDNTNLMASNLTKQVRDISQVATAIAGGELGRKITVEVRGELLELKNTINTMVDQLSSFADEVTRVARDVGVEGKLGGRAEVRGVSGIWKELTDNVNIMASNLTNQVRDIAQVTTAVANGDLSRKITVEVRGEILELKNTINTMVDQLSSFADEVTRVAREVGTEGILGGQAQVRGVSGTWRELTDNVNIMARNLTQQVRGIARVVTAVAEGDLKQELRLDAKGEIATLAQTINNMLVTLSTFADQVSGVARDVGVLGKLGGQADVPGAAGVWRDLTSNVNELAGNLTRQVRAIGDVATAVTKGDLTRTIAVDAQGEVAFLKDNINQMIQTLANTTRANRDQDWLKTNLARFTRMLQGQRDLSTVAEQVLSELAPVVEAQYGSFFMARQRENPDGKNGKIVLESFATYGHADTSRSGSCYELGQGLVGEAARQRKPITLRDVPQDYATIGSSLGATRPTNLIVFPVLFEGDVKGIIELASIRAFTRIQLAFIEQLIDSLGIVIATIEATMRTDELLRSSQGMAQALRKQQDALRYTNEQLEEKARQLTAQRDEVARKNQEIELAKQELEQNAEQLALTSKYKSEFLASMSHELRTPLNSLLILSRQLADNRNNNLDERQVEYARTIHDAGSDLLALINEILDLAKIESGTMALSIEKVQFKALHEYIDRSFAHLAREKGLVFSVTIADGLPEGILTDEMRLRQVLRNLISNALKFTDSGTVSVCIESARESTLQRAGDELREDGVIAFSVTDTGIGIPLSQQHRVFEAFQQGDGGSSRKYGGTGLGLSISREIATLLGGELLLESVPSEGSTFTLLLPRTRNLEGARDVAVTDREVEQASRTPTGQRAPVSTIQPGERVVLLLTQDGQVSRGFQPLAQEHALRFVPVHRAEDGLHAARTLQPSLMILDLALQDAHSWVLLDLVKHTPHTRHLPVAVIGWRGDRRRAFAHGACAMFVRGNQDDWQAVLESTMRWWQLAARRRLLVVEGQALRGVQLRELFESDSVDITVVDDRVAMNLAVKERPVDCVVLDSDIDGVRAEDFLRDLAQHERATRLRAVVYAGGREPQWEQSARAAASSPLPTRYAHSVEQLVDLVSLFLHSEEDSLPEPSRGMLGDLVYSDPSLRGRKVLIVDDDVRNLYAITAVLEPHGIEVVFAENGEEALQLVEQQADIDLILMDIMMPGMDGYHATQRIRSLPGRTNLPIIALTAKAMRTDRDKCLEAGASDYVTKPVEPELLTSVLRVWLSATPWAHQSDDGAELPALREGVSIVESTRGRSAPVS